MRLSTIPISIISQHLFPETHNQYKKWLHSTIIAARLHNPLWDGTAGGFVVMAAACE